VGVLGAAFSPDFDGSNAPERKRSPIAKESTERAETLSIVLSEIDAERLFEWNEYPVFGASCFEELMDGVSGQPSDEDEDRECNLALVRFLQDAKVWSGQLDSARRLSVGSAPPFSTHACDDLSHRDMEKLRRDMEKLSRLSQEKIEPTVRAGEKDARPKGRHLQFDCLDAAFSDELVGKLPKIVKRASAMKDISLDLLPQEECRAVFLRGPPLLSLRLPGCMRGPLQRNH
jgi:hypothetical protein